MGYLPWFRFQVLRHPVFFVHNIVSRLQLLLAELAKDKSVVGARVNTNMWWENLLGTYLQSTRIQNGSLVK